MPAQPSWIRIRTFVLDTKAAEEYDQYELELELFEKAWKALEWLLGRDPTIGVFKDVANNKYWLYKQDSDPFAMTPTITVLYTFDDNHIYIHGIKAKRPENTWRGTA